MFADLPLAWQSLALGAYTAVSVLIWLNVRYVLPPLIRHLHEALTAGEAPLDRARMEIAVRLSDRRAS